MTKKALGETEKTILVGGLIVAAWLGIDAVVKRAERRDVASDSGDRQRRAGVGRPRRRLFARRRRAGREAA